VFKLLKTPTLIDIDSTVLFNSKNLKNCSFFIVKIEIEVNIFYCCLGVINWKIGLGISENKELLFLNLYFWFFMVNSSQIFL
jgi:hypothetical protein